MSKSDDAFGSRPLPLAQVEHQTIDEASEGQRLDNFLLRVLKGVPKTHVYRVIRAGEVRVNKKRVSADQRLMVGDVVRVPPVRRAQSSSAESENLGDGNASTAPPREFTVLFEDDALVAVDKPAGVAVHGGSGVAFGVIEQLRRARAGAKFIELVHRLDKETSGVLLVAKKRSALTHLQAQFRARRTDKTYAALVFGTWPAHQRVIDVPLHKGLDAAGERHVRAVSHADDVHIDDARRSITLVNVVERYAEHTLLDVTIKTGRTHQIRVHTAHVGMPVVGDPKYGDFERNRLMARGPFRFARMFLHARRLAFDHPVTGERVVVESALPQACRALLDGLHTSR